MDKQISPPCQAACPIHQDVREYINLIARGEFDQAIGVIRKTNPLPASCGYICAHHCQDECRRTDVDGALSIKALKRFAEESSSTLPAPAPEYAPVPTLAHSSEPALDPAAHSSASVLALDHASAPGSSPSPESLADQRKTTKIAIVGAGPAGLAAAQVLVRSGYSITVFDRSQQAGGALRNFIPLYRLPHEAIDRDVAILEKEGAEFKLGYELGTNFTPAQLFDEGYSAVLLCLGLPQSRKLDLPGAEHENAILALPFLYNVKYEGYRLNGEHVIVIGGGNVAMDVARSARRCGAGSVKVVCLECRTDMPAFPWEIEEAAEEGIEFFPSGGPKAILIKEGKISGLETKKVLSVFDKEGRFSPTFDERDTKVVDGNMVIFAIGQAGETESLKKSNIPMDKRNRMIFDRKTMMTPVEGVFACGEVADGPGTAAEAMASGIKAAETIERYLRQEKEIFCPAETEETLPKLPEETIEKIKPVAQVSIPIVEASKRATNFDPVEIRYTLMQALQESHRCLSCGAGAVQDEEECVHCLTCMRTCPYDVPHINEEGLLELRHDFCQSCGLCLAVCPARAITFQSPEVETAQANVASIFKETSTKVEGRSKLLIFACAYAPFAMEFFNHEFFQDKPEEVELIKWSCVSKIDSLDILRAFEHDADKILIVGCAEDSELTCPYHDTLTWIEKRTKYVQEIIKQVGLSSEQLSLVSLPPSDCHAFNQAVKEKLL